MEVEKKNMNLYWYRDYFYPQGFRDTEKEETPALQPYHRETYETETDDEFDADSYSNPEDFYYDYYDDFYDYEDAEDYNKCPFTQIVLCVAIPSNCRTIRRPLSAVSSLKSRLYQPFLRGTNPSLSLAEKSTPPSIA